MPSRAPRAIGSGGARCCVQSLQPPGGTADATSGPRLERQMIRAHPATATTETDDPPADRTMRIVEVSLAILAIAAAGILALLR